MLTTGARASIPSRVRQESRLPSTSIGVVPASTTFTREACAPRSATRNSRAASELAMKSGVRATAKAVRRRPNFLGRMTSRRFEMHVDAPVARQIRPQRMFGRDVYGRSASGRRVQSRATRAPMQPPALCNLAAVPVRWLRVPGNSGGEQPAGTALLIGQCENGNIRSLAAQISGVSVRTPLGSPEYRPREHDDDLSAGELVLSLSGLPISAYRPTSAASRRRTRGKRRDSRSVILRSSWESDSATARTRPRAPQHTRPHRRHPWSEDAGRPQREVAKTVLGKCKAASGLAARSRLLQIAQSVAQTLVDDQRAVTDSTIQLVVIHDELVQRAPRAFAANSSCSILDRASEVPDRCRPRRSACSRLRSGNRNTSTGYHARSGTLPSRTTSRSLDTTMWWGPRDG